MENRRRNNRKKTTEKRYGAGGGSHGSRRTSGRRRALTKRQRRVRVLRKRILLGSLALVVLVVMGSVLGRLLRERTAEEPPGISAACEAYRSQVESIAAQYEMTPYVELIMAVMMQESAGQGTDVMQASECQFNTEYPRRPNGITDTAYSIWCGIQELRHALILAEAEGPRDYDAIGLALQGYNFGSDSYLSYMKEKGEETWSHETASAFAKMASGGVMRKESDGFYETAGKWQYGDQYYTEHVLRYYVYYQEDLQKEQAQ